MSSKLRSVLGSGVALAACALLAPAASGDGLPLPLDGAENAGVRSPDGSWSYATVGWSYDTVRTGGDTEVLRIATGTGEIQRSTGLNGVYGIPLVAYDGTASGLSADGRTLVLIRPRTTFPRQQTTFAEFDAERLKLRGEITLPGDFSFDALSPDGRTMYLIRYTDPRDPTSYQVRAYDLARDRLLPDPIIDPNESGEEMAGLPQTRAVSPDGRWAYTLYDPMEGNEHPPFIHALDTQRGTAVCIDLDSLTGFRDVYRLGLEPSPDGSSLAVVDRGAAVASVNLDTFEVGEPPAEPTAATTSSDDGGGTPWAAIAAGVALLAAACSAVVIRRRRGDDEVDEAELERLVRLDAEARGEESDRECEPVR